VSKIFLITIIVHVRLPLICKYDTELAKLLPDILYNVTCTNVVRYYIKIIVPIVPNYEESGLLM
jgi:hypothetical protein